ncbi:MAG: TIGR01244 family phosphatase [Ponticaulis sp.]|nr:TIGR01244 family phosphatase [Ponticaulis sp.]|tara:strand:+ start:61007 stop:61441 length:435 start_codon:yes stop_codon:yes gene_type:complete
MSDFRQITENFFVAPQITAEDVKAAREVGFQALIMNRPDGETPDQPDTQELIDTANELGLSFYHIPIVAPPEAQDVEATVNALQELDGKKVLAFCRSGTRSATLWAYAMAWQNQMSVGDIIGYARDAGYDLSGHTPRLTAIASG